MVISNPTLEAAQALHKMGLCVIPLHYGTKHPTVKWSRYQHERAAYGVLRRWFKNGKRNLGVLCGEVSGYLCGRDFDHAPEYERWASDYPKWAARLPTVKTSRGAHVWFRNGSLAGIKHLPDKAGELRGAGIVLVPPSLHPSGVEYRWIVPPNGEIPVVDPFEIGLAPKPHPVETERAEKTEKTEGTEDYKGELKAMVCVSPDPEAAILATLPQGQGYRNQLIFEFARRLKAIPSLADAPMADLRPYVVEWHRRAFPVIGTQDFETTWFDFSYGWGRVKFPFGQGPIRMIYEASLRAGTPLCASNYDSEGIKQLAGLCRELQRNAKEGTFYLGTRTAGAMLGVDHVQAWRWLRVLQVDEIIKEMSKGSMEKGKRPQASRYRWMKDP